MTALTDSAQGEPQDSAILVASDLTTDAKTMAKLLKEEFKAVQCSTNADAIVEEFEAAKPKVLMLGFNSIEKAEHYSLVLNKQSVFAQGHRYRTVLLCDAKASHKAYRLCRDRLFDDYVVFWPIGHDSNRLLMAAHHALQSLEHGSSEQPSVTELAREVLRLKNSGQELEKLGTRGSNRISETSVRAQAAAKAISDEIKALESQLQRGDLGSTELPEERAQTIMDGLSQLEQVSSNHLNDMLAEIDPLRNWGKSLTDEIKQQQDRLTSASEVAGKVRQKVLVVDDDDFQLRLLERQTGELALELAGVQSGSQALQFLRTESPDLIFLDVEMPGEDGIELLGKIRLIERLARLPVVMLTGRKDKATVQRCVEAGAAGYLVKPITKRLLAESLNKHLSL